MSAQPICPDCGSELPGDAPGGLCPRCLLGAVLAGQATSPTPDETTLPLGQEPATADDPDRDVATWPSVETEPTSPDAPAPMPAGTPTVEVPSPRDIP